MKFGPMISYYGAKHLNVGDYPTPEFPCIVEPFAGSAGYSTRYYNRQVVLCDRDEDIVAVWRYLLAASPAELLALPDIPEGKTTDDLAIPPEARVLIGYWLNRGAVSANKKPSAWMRSREYHSSFWGRTVRQRLARQVPLIQHWRVFCCDYREAPVVGPATWFVDPPYQGRPGSHYRYGSRGLDYNVLGEWCRARPGQVIACEAQGAVWLPFAPLGLRRTIRRGGGKSPEAVCVLRDGALVERAQCCFDIEGMA
jgi:hypothetical protein